MRFPTDRKRCADGTACRIVRFERTSSRHGGGGYLVVLEGLARISFDPATALTAIPSHHDVDDATIAAPVYSLLTVTVHPAAAATLSPQDAKLLAPLRDAATAVLDALTATVPAPLPAVFERRLRTLIGRLSLASAPALIDALFGTLPLSTPPDSSTNESTNATTAAIGLTHADKLLILSLVSAPLRLEKAISILSRAREGLSTRDRIDQTVARRQREFALLQQLLAIRTELDQLAKESGRSGGGNAQTKGSSSSSLPGSGSKAITSRKKGLVPSRKGRAGGGFAADDGAADEDDEEEDEMAELERKVEAKQFSDEARRVAHREMKRLKKTPPQGAEHGVIRAFSLFFPSLSLSLGDSKCVSPESRLLMTSENMHRHLHRDAAGDSVDRSRLDSAAVVSRLCRAGEEETRPGPLWTRCASRPFLLSCALLSTMRRAGTDGLSSGRNRAQTRSKSACSNGSRFCDCSSSSGKPISHWLRTNPLSNRRRRLQSRPRPKPRPKLRSSSAIRRWLLLPFRLRLPRSPLRHPTRLRYCSCMVPPELERLRLRDLWRKQWVASLSGSSCALRSRLGTSPLILTSTRAMQHLTRRRSRRSRDSRPPSNLRRRDARQSCRSFAQVRSQEPGRLARRGRQDGTPEHARRSVCGDARGA